jgi:hypothetical protein
MRLKSLVTITAVLFVSPVFAESRLADAVATLAKSDAAGTSCDMPALAKIFADDIKATVVIKDAKTSKNEVHILRKPELLELAGLCKKPGVKSIFDRDLVKAEVTESGRIDINGTFSQTDISLQDNKVVVGSGNFMTSLRCDAGGCQIITDVTWFKSLQDKVLSEPQK